MTNFVTAFFPSFARLVIIVIVLSSFAWTARAETNIYRLAWTVDKNLEQFIEGFTIYQQLQDGEMVLVVDDIKASSRGITIWDNVVMEDDQSVLFVRTIYQDGFSTWSDPYLFVQHLPAQITNVWWATTENFTPLIKDRRIKERP